MYIEDKLFSDYSGETLYSVILTEDEYKVFSEFLLRNYTSIRDAKKALKLRGRLLKSLQKKGVDVKEMTSDLGGKLVLDDFLRHATLKPYSPETLTAIRKAKGKVRNKLNKITVKEGEKVQQLTGGNVSQLYGLF